MQRTYISIDLKSFYASVECRERGLDPLDTNLVVADERRTDKTICLAVTPSLKSYGIPGRFVVLLCAAAGRAAAGTGFYYCAAADGLLYGIQHANLRNLSALCGAGRYHSLFCGRGIYGRNAIF